MNEDYRKLYDAVTANNFDVGDYETFLSKMETPEQRRNFYDAMASNNLDLGGYDAYEARLKKKDTMESDSALVAEEDGLDFGFDANKTALDLQKRFQPESQAVRTAPVTEDFQAEIDELNRYWDVELDKANRFLDNIPQGKSKEDVIAFGERQGIPTPEEVKEDKEKAIQSARADYYGKGERVILNKYKDEILSSLTEEQRNAKDYIRKLDDKFFLDYGLDLDLEGNGRYNEQWLAEDFLRSIGSGTVDLLAGPISLMGAANPETLLLQMAQGKSLSEAYGDTRREVYKSLAETSEGIREGMTQYKAEDSGISASLANGDYYNGFRRFTEGLGGLLPQVGATVAAAYSGGTTLAITGTGIVGGVNYYGQTELEDIEAIENGETPLYDNTGERLGGAFVSGGSDALYAAIGLKGTGTIAKQLPKSWSTGVMKRFGVEPVVGAVEEGAAEATIMGYESVVGNANYTAEEYKNRIIDAGLLGYAGEVAFNSTRPDDHSGRARTAVESRSEKANQDNTDVELAETIAQNPESEDTLSEPYKDADRKKKEQKKERVRFFEMLSVRHPEDMNEVQSLDGRIEKKSREIEKINDLDIENKTEVKEALERQLEDLVAQREAVLNKHADEGLDLTEDETQSLVNSRVKHRIKAVEEELAIAQEAVDELTQKGVEGRALEDAIAQRDKVKKYLDEARRLMGEVEAARRKPADAKPEDTSEVTVDEEVDTEAEAKPEPSGDVKKEATPDVRGAENALLDYLKKPVNEKVKVEEDVTKTEEDADVEPEARIEDEPTSEPETILPEPKEKLFEKYTGANPFKKVLNNLNSLRKKYLTARGFLPKNVYRQLEKEQGAIASQSKLVESNMKRFYKMIEKYSGDKDVLLDLYDRALRGDKEAMNQLPDDFAFQAVELRNHVDNLTRKAIEAGVFDLSTEAGRKKKETFESNIGKYLTRSYEVFDNKNYLDKLSDEVITKAKNYIRKSIKESARVEYENNKELQSKFDSFESYLDDRVDATVKRYTTKETARQFVEGKSKLGKGSDVSKKLKEIPAEIRALMGEYSDPMTNYAKSVLKLTTAVEGQRTLNKIRELGLNKFLFSSPTGNFTAQIASKNSEALRPLNGLYTTPEVKAALESVPEQLSRFMEIYTNQVSSRVKWAKTIGSLATHGKNVIGNLGFMWSNGHTDLKALSTAYKVIKNDIKSGGDKALLERARKYVELGLTNQNISLREINDMFGSTNLEDAMLERLTKKNLTKKLKGWIPSLKKKSFVLPEKFEQFLEDMYQAEDDFFKIVAFENEIARYSDALYGKPYNKLTAEQQQALDEYVADKVVKQTYPSYDRVPEGVRSLSKIWLGNFVSFVAESYRVSFNTVKLGAQEIKSDNPKLRAIGAKRLGGSLTYLAAKSNLVAFFGKAAGVGAAGLLGLALDDEEEKKTQRALNSFVAPWSKNSDLIILKQGDGKFTYVDLSASDPFGNLSQIANAMTKDGLSIGSFVDGLIEAVNPFTDPDIGTRRLLNLRYNKDDNGKPIYNTEDSFEDQSEDIIKYIYEVFELGTITSVRKIFKAEDKGQEAIGQVTGAKPITVDVAESLGYNMIGFKKRIADARKLRRTDLDQANKSLREIEQEIYELSQDALVLGVDMKDIKKKMMDWGGIGEERSRFILTNRYYPLTPVKD